MRTKLKRKSRKRHCAIAWTIQKKSGEIVSGIFEFRTRRNINVVKTYQTVNSVIKTIHEGQFVFLNYTDLTRR